MENQQVDPIFSTRPINIIRRNILKHMRNVTFLGISGNITIDVEGDRIADYALLDQTNIDGGLFEVIFFFYKSSIIRIFKFVSFMFMFRWHCVITVQPKHMKPSAKFTGPMENHQVTGPNVTLMEVDVKVNFFFYYY